MTESARSHLRVLAVLIVPAGLLLLSAVMRLPDLATRGTWDADQGHDMLVLRAFVRDGVVPLLGPPTSIGDVHHGALYYYLLAPAAFLTSGDSPLAVTTLIALAGIIAVAVTWWLARDIGGPVAGLVAGLVMAVSASAVEESTFIWNPNLIALSSAIALAGAWRAWTSRQPRWWLLAAVGLTVTMQCHVLGFTMLPIVGGFLVANARTRAPGPERRRVWLFGLAGVAIIALSFVPLAIRELTSGFTEIAAALDYIRAGGDPVAMSPIGRFLVVGARVVSWPLTGLITDAPLATLVSTAVVIAIAVWRALAGGPAERRAARWLGFGLLWTAFALTFISPGLATVVPGLPNDHYHAFADPMVFTLIGLGAQGLWRLKGSTRLPAVAGRTVAVAGVGVLLAWNLIHQPRSVHPDGGFPAAELAVARIVMATGGGELTLRSLPEFKSVEAYAYPLLRSGAALHAGPAEPATGPVDPAAGTLVIICDAAFEVAIGAQCGGPAEATIAPPERFGPPVDRFMAAPGRTISIYRPTP